MHDSDLLNVICRAVMTTMKGTVRPSMASILKTANRCPEIGAMKECPVQHSGRGFRVQKVLKSKTLNS